MDTTIGDKSVSDDMMNSDFMKKGRCFLLVITLIEFYVAPFLAYGALIAYLSLVVTEIVFSLPTNLTLKGLFVSLRLPLLLLGAYVAIRQFDEKGLFIVLGYLQILLAVTFAILLTKPDDKIPICDQ